MKYLILFLAFYIISCSLRSVNKEVRTCHIEFSIDYFGIIAKIEKIPDTVNIKIKRNLFCKAVILSCGGDMEIYALDSNHRILLRGAYCASKDTIIDTLYTEDAETGALKMGLTKYLKPKREGEWIYYDSIGKIEKKEIYERGQPIKLINFN